MVLLASIFMTGCYDATEIDDEVYTLVIGADKGVNNKVRVTVQYPTYQDGGGGGGGGGGSEGGGGESKIRDVSGTVIVTAEAPTILEAMNVMNNSVPRRISLRHTKMFVVSEDYARSGIGHYLAPMVRFREARRIMQVVVCDGTAEGFIEENKSLIGPNMSKSMELMASQSENTAFFPRATFHDFYKAALSHYQQPYAAYAGLNDFKAMEAESVGAEPPLRTEHDIKPGKLPLKGTAKREFSGTAVFDGDKMVGYLNQFETRYFLMVSGEFKRAIMTIEDKNKPGAAIPLDVRLGRKPVIKGRIENGVPVIDISLNIEADIGAIQSRIDYESLDNIEELNGIIGKHIEDGVKKTVAKTQNLGTDIFGFGYYFADDFLTIQEWEKYKWNGKYRNAKVNVKVDANVRRTGLMFESFPIERSQ